MLLPRNLLEFELFLRGAIIMEQAFLSIYTEQNGEILSNTEQKSLLCSRLLNIMDLLYISL